MSTLSRATGTTRERRARDFYPTIDPRAVAKLLPHLPPDAVIAEPCAGDGELMHQLAIAGRPCLWGADIEPQRRHIAKQDALLLAWGFRKWNLRGTSDGNVQLHNEP